MDNTLATLYEKAVSSGCEQYLPIDVIIDFIDICNLVDIVIIAVDFFILEDNKVQPFEALTGFDSSTLFDESTGRHQNVLRCNSFVMDCYRKVKEKLSGLYFTTVLEYDR